MRPLQDLLMVAYGPKTVLEQSLAGVPRIDRAVIVGSWAARYAGTPGELPRDVDLVVVGAPDRDDVADRASDASTRLGRDVQVTFRSTAAWEQAAGSFTATVRASPQVELRLAAGQEGA